MLDWEVLTQRVALASTVSQWMTLSVGTGFYEPRDSIFDLVVELESVGEVLTWYADLDADGWGDDTAPILAAVRPSFATDNAGDCDDTRADVHPAGLEVCDDGFDSDCDGIDTCATVQDGPGSPAVQLVVPYDTWLQAAPAGDLSGDGIQDLFAGGRVVAGPFTDDVDVGGPVAASIVGAFVSPAGDLDGDGNADVVAKLYTGPVHLLFGPFSGEIDAATCGTLVSSALVTGEDFVPQATGDTDGDGLSELLVLGEFEKAGESVAGFTLYRGPFDGGRTDLDADVRVELPPFGDSSADDMAVEAADLDSDGLDDLVVYDSDNGGLIVLVAPLAAEYTAAGLIDRPIADPAPVPALALGDYDGDGDPDIAFPELLADDLVPSVSLVSEVGAEPFAVISSSADLNYRSPALWNLLADGGDLDGNGVDDLVLSISRDDVGDALWLEGPIAGVIDAEAVGVSYPGITWLGPAGDLNGDALDDLLATGTVGPGEVPAGLPIYLLSGASDASPAFPRRFLTRARTSILYASFGRSRCDPRSSSRRSSSASSRAASSGVAPARLRTKPTTPARSCRSGTPSTRSSRSRRSWTTTETSPPRHASRSVGARPR
ncbi:MAG: putative metal-binding motif-containing protein [Deltaproteobacteria bacterium]|nr:putative metal-binding motif-containing protein [Deltaproteobacteria bacterium]